MKTLTILQPWANALLCGQKRYETRSWATPYRGLIALHAGKKRVPRALILDKNARLLPYGALIGVGWLNDCLPVEHLVLSDAERQWGDFSPGRYAWEIVSIHPLQPTPYAGQLGLWQCPLL